MSKYTTGEIAKLCGVTVRTVQYYDTRGILIPSSLSEGGRRLYSEDDLKRMKVICFLRELDIPIDAISQILKEEHPEKVIELLIEQQESVLSAEISEKQEKLEKLQELKNGLKGKEAFSLETIGDIAVIMEGKKKLKKMHWMMILTGTPVTALQWFSILFWIVKGIWWPFGLSPGRSWSAGTISIMLNTSVRNVTRYSSPHSKKRFGQITLQPPVSSPAPNAVTRASA